MKLPIPTGHLTFRAVLRDTICIKPGNQLVLVDDLIPGELNNPVWCTYGPCPNCSYLIDQDGIIHTTQIWFNAEGMEKAINDLLGVN